MIHETESKHHALVIAIGSTVYLNNEVHNVLVIKRTQVKEKHTLKYNL